jgi:hypothetical protein
MQQNSGGSSAGSALGKTLAKAAKPRSTGASVGRSVARSTRSKGSSVGSSAGRVNRTSSRSSSSRRSSGSSSSHRSSSSSSSHRSSTPRVSAPKPKAVARPVVPVAPKPPSIDSYLAGDSIYQQTLSGGKRTLADLLSEIARRKGEAGTQYTQTRSGMESDRTDQLESLRNEFASRGLINSGLYAEEQGNFQKKFTDQLTALDQQQSGLMADLLSQENNAKREQDLALQAAKQEALARRAAKYKIGA